MSLVRKGVFIVAGKRTPYGSFGGSLMNKSCTDLAEIACKAAVTQANISPEHVDSVIFGNVIQSNQDTAYLARHAALRIGVPISSPGLVVNRLCGSSFQSVVSAAHEIVCGDSHVVIAGGAENMSEVGFVVRNTRFGTRFGVEYKFEDILWNTLTDHYAKIPMGLTAEKLAEQYGITREQCDEYALKSQTRWKAAHESGAFQAEMAPVSVKTKKGPIDLAQDEHPRDTNMQVLGKLPPVFKKNGTVTAGNASGVSDGAGALVLASEEALSKHNLKPLARIVSYSAVGCEPTIMGIGPAHAIRNVLKASEKTLEQIDLVEVNEAFAAQYLAVEKDLGLNPDRTNMCGGAIALGHPVGASGSRIMSHLVHQLQQKQDSQLAIGSACIGGGQGIAILIEKC